MSSFSRLKHRDLRALYLALGECCELGRCPEAWLQRLHERFAQLVGAEFSFVFDRHDGSRVARLALSSEDRALAFGCPLDAFQRVAKAYFDNDVGRHDPPMQTFARLAGTACTLPRQQLAPDLDWYRSMAYNEYYRTLGVDQYLASRRPLEDGGALVFVFWREIGGASFDDRATAVLSLAHSEIANLVGQGRLVLPREAEKPLLSQRQQQVLQLVGEGLTEKEVAGELGISIHTVHDHVKALHRILGVGTRGELVGVACAIACEGWPDRPSFHP